MGTERINEKRELRVRLKAVLAALMPAQRAARSAAACGRALAADLFPAGSTVMLYAPMVEQGEVDLRLLADGLIRRGCRLCVARVDWERGTMEPALVEDLEGDLVPDERSPVGRAGGEAAMSGGLRTAREDAAAVQADSLDVIVVPGLGFDRAGHRIGRGAGFYDRFLAEMPAERPVRVALAFDEQVVEMVPVEAHDMGVQTIITPTEIIRLVAPRC